MQEWQIKIKGVFIKLAIGWKKHYFFKSNDLYLDPPKTIDNVHIKFGVCQATIG